MKTATFKTLALGAALLMVGCSSTTAWKNDYYTANGKADDQFAYDKDQYECERENTHTKVYPGWNQVPTTKREVDKSQYRACMRVRGWSKSQ